MAGIDRVVTAPSGLPLFVVRHATHYSQGVCLSVSDRVHHRLQKLVSHVEGGTQQCHSVWLHRA